ncbi:crossover junction endodeoxyribonuclease RuvC [Pedobacter sp.]|nr:crossover junction endodeoxyribonuclease RuvC [Candidatus Saccharibacteria bacterium]
MRIIGIDPGTGIMGFGVIEKGKTTSLVDAGVIRTLPHQPLDERLVEIYESLQEIIAETKPSVMVIEKLFFARNVTTAISVAHARGVAMLAGKQAGLEIVEYTPMQIKQSVTGYGGADKKQVQEMVRIQLGLKVAPQPDDCADALAAALMHATMLAYNSSTPTT